MQNRAYTLAGLSAVLALVLLSVADGSGTYTPLGTALVVVALLLVGVGKGIDLLSHVRDGATDGNDSP